MANKSIAWEPLYTFMRKRHEIYLARASGAPWPWTTDPILQTYKFTNVYRELDRVTVWVDDNIRRPFAKHQNLWFMLCIARQINWPESLAALIEHDTAWPHTLKEWDWRSLVKVLRARAMQGEKVYTGAYMLNAHGADRPEIQKYARFDKPLFTGRLVLQKLWENRREVAPRLNNTMEEAVDALKGNFGWGGFMSYEVACDLRYTRYLRAAPDVGMWAFAGPGAKRGLCRLLGLEVRPHMNINESLEYMRQLLGEIEYHWPYNPPLEMREIEHSLCEFDKYERARLGEGRPRSKYHPTEEQ